MFDYRDYDRTIVGFHGTTVAAANRLVDGGSFTPSSKIYEWFGKGVYFWEYAPKQAWWWTRDHKKYPQPAVVGAVIRLGDCLDLLDPRNVKIPKELKDEMVALLVGANKPVPTNARQKR